MQEIEANFTGATWVTGIAGKTGTMTIKSYYIPKEWINEMEMEKSIPKPYPWYRFGDTEPFSITEKEVLSTCRLYLKIKDKNLWPALLGKSEIMDRVLEEEFRK